MIPPGSRRFKCVLGVFGRLRHVTGGNWLKSLASVPFNHNWMMKVLSMSKSLGGERPLRLCAHILLKCPWGPRSEQSAPKQHNLLEVISVKSGMMLEDVFRVVVVLFCQSFLGGFGSGDMRLQSVRCLFCLLIANSFRRRRRGLWKRRWQFLFFFFDNS